MAKSRGFMSIGEIIAESGTRDFAWEKKYTDYIQSPEWRQKRREAITRAMNRCERCQRLSHDNRGLEVHHKTYKNFGNEPLTDLEALCKNCHERADEERRKGKKKNG